MNDLAQSFIANATQCWSCPIFDRMFQVVSNAAAAAYDNFVMICTILFCAIFALYVFGAVWKNMTTGFQDGWFDKSLRPIFINSLFALAFLGMGTMLPRFITTITFEPVAQVTQTYADAMIQMTYENVDIRVPDNVPDMNDDNGIFRQELRDSIINTARVTITMFQSFMSLGVAMLDTGFSWEMFTGVGALLKHIILAVMGIYLFYAFFKMFFEFLCYFADVIIAMAMFAFFFPLSLVTSAFREASDVPYWLSWIKSLGKTVGVDQIKNLIGAIVSLGVAVITYTIILVIITKFFADPDGVTNHFNELLMAIMSGDVFEQNLDTTTMNDLSLTSIVVLVYVLGFIYKKIPDITNMILQMFEVTADKNEVGNAMSKDMMAATKGFLNRTGKGIKTVVEKIRS